MQDNKNFILAIALCAAVLLVSEFLIWGPQRQQLQEQQQEQTTADLNTSTGTAPAGDNNGSAPLPNVSATGAAIDNGTANSPTANGEVAGSRESIIASTQRVPIDTPSLIGSINLQGARVDDLSLKNYRETIEKDSPIIELFSPSGSPNAYYSEFRWLNPSDNTQPLPGPNSQWQLVSGNRLSPSTQVTLRWDNGADLVFTRTYTIDDDFLITLRDEVENNTSEQQNLLPFALVARHSIPELENFFILHEGMIGFLGEEGLQEIDYDELQEADNRTVGFSGENDGWLGITDKYWAAAVIPQQGEKFNSARFVNYTTSLGNQGFQADFTGNAVSVAAGGSGEYISHLYAGAKEVNVINKYRDELQIERFDLMIDWGWFYFITKPLFTLIDWLFNLFGNFGLAILGATVVIKLFFFPLANKSYASMANMKKVQPQLVEIRERHKDDRPRQQKAMMELYKKEKINPLTGCLPMLLQIPVFFALYKVLFVTIEMRHQPFFGWIQDLAAPDPTSLFNLFGILPFEVPAILLVGVWPLLMGITMFLQMRLNPTPPDKTQAMIFTWMPVLFTFMLARFPAGLVIYWAWNNFLSIIQQTLIMRRQGVEVEIWKNTKEALGFGKKEDKAE